MLKKFLVATTIAVTCAVPALAAPTLDDIIAQLKGQGFTEITVSRTWLGRYRIEAESETQEREIVFNKRTGEILRDYWEDIERDDDDEGGSDDQDTSDEDADGSDQDGSDEDEDDNDDD